MQMLHHRKVAGSELEDSYLQASGRGGQHILSGKATDLLALSKITLALFWHGPQAVGQTTVVCLD
jgi:hypothetical protein